ncbi:MAG: hypothetical protein GY874_02520 [Desulfobacteraceae bacterium]|nr:hypothetical protein [Desulfobacteraceae bacterium]
MKNLVTFIDGMMRSTCPKIKNPVKVIHERKKFLELVELERDRAHRSNQQFSLIVMRVNENKTTAIHELAHKILERVRRIDQVGWYANAHLGVLLPNTTNTGAQTIAKAIYDSQDSSRSVIALQTLSYPDK